jgi:hypothetical protein
VTLRACCRAQLIGGVCDGEREGFYELVRPYERMVYATAISIVKNPADAGEVAQEKPAQTPRLGRRELKLRSVEDWP